MLVCTFAGHREVFKSGIAQAVRLLVDTILDNEDQVLFYNGGMGEFDNICARVVKEAKQNNPGKSIENILVLPYMQARLNRQKAYFETTFDHIMVLELPANMHYKHAIQARNRWMVDQADWVIAYLDRTFGGAFQTVAYAQRQKKTVIKRQ